MDEFPKIEINNYSYPDLEDSNDYKVCLEEHNVSYDHNKLDNGIYNYIPNYSAKKAEEILKKHRVVIVFFKIDTF